MDELQVLDKLISRLAPIGTCLPIRVMLNAAAVCGPANEKIRGVPLEPTIESSISGGPSLGHANTRMRINKSTAAGLGAVVVAVQTKRVGIAIAGPQFEIERFTITMDEPPEFLLDAMQEFWGLQCDVDGSRQASPRSAPHRV